MRLSENQVIKLIQKKPNNTNIELGLKYESRLSVFTESLFYNNIERESGYMELLQIMENTLHPNKYKRTKDFFNYPLPIVNISKDVIGDIYRVFDSRNSNFSNDYGDNKTLQEVAESLLTNLGVRHFIETQGKKVLKNKPNTFVVVDKDLEGNPYLLNVPNEDLLGLEWKDNNYIELKYIIFKHSNFTDDKGNKGIRIAFYDDEFYRVIRKVDTNYTLEEEIPHNLGYTPARPFLSSRLNSKNTFDRYNPLSSALSTMANWTLFDVYLRYAEYYGVFPIVEMAKPTCTNNDCENGYISYPLENGGMSAPKECPSCKKNQILGAGTVLQIDAAEHNEEKDHSGIFRFISPPTENIKFEGEKQDERERNIKENTKGYANPSDKEAMNIEHIRALMEGAKKPLLFISMQLNNLHKWIVKTSVKLAFDADVHVHANYGTEWFLLTESEIQKLFLDSKTAGMPESELDELYKLLVETKYKNNPHLIQKLLIENNINPAPYLSLKECIENFKIGVMNQMDLAVKANFTALLKKFERDNGSIEDFGRDAILQGSLTFATKIERIYSELIKYINENEQNNSTESDRVEGDTEANS